MITPLDLTASLGVYPGEQQGRSGTIAYSHFVDAGAPLSDLDYDSSDDEVVAKKKAKTSAFEDEEPESLPRQSTSKALQQQAYESLDLITTVSVEVFSLSRSSSPSGQPTPVMNADGEVIYPENDENSHKSSKSGISAGKKRVKNKANMKVKMTRSDKRARATSGKNKKDGNGGFLGTSGVKGTSGSGRGPKGKGKKP